MKRSHSAVYGAAAEEDEICGQDGIESEMNGKLWLSIVLFFVLLPSLAATPCAEGDEPEEAKPAKGSVLKFTLPEHDLFPESIAFDPVSECYFLSSLGQSRIIRIKKDGSYEDFVATSDEGLLSSVGMKVDARRRALWVCYGRYSLHANQDLPAETGLLEYDLEKGTLTHRWSFPQASSYHIFNDLALGAGGEVYATTTLIGKVYKVTPKSRVIEPILKLKPGGHNNGITLDPKGNYLFLTIDRSISRLNLTSGELTGLKMPRGEGMGVDGLYFYEGSLVAVMPRFNRVVRYFLDESLTTVELAKTLIQGHADFAYPTTGVIVGNKLVLVATSFADRPRKPDSGEQHGDVLIYELAL